MRVLELKNCTKQEIQSMLYSIDKQGFDTVQINNSSYDDIESICRDASFRGIRIILEVNNGNKPDSYLIRTLNNIVQMYGINKLVKAGIQNFKLVRFDLGLEFMTRLESRTINKIYYDKDYKDVLSSFDANEEQIAYLTNYYTYQNMCREELDKYRMFLPDLYTLLTGSYENTLFSPIIANGIMDTSFLDNEKIKQANKQLVRRKEL